MELLLGILFVVGLFIVWIPIYIVKGLILLGQWIWRWPVNVKAFVGAVIGASLLVALIIIQVDPDPKDAQSYFRGLQTQWFPSPLEKTRQELTELHTTYHELESQLTKSDEGQRRHQTGIDSLQKELSATSIAQQRDNLLVNIATDQFYLEKLQEYSGLLRSTMLDVERDIRLYESAITFQEAHGDSAEIKEIMKNLRRVNEKYQATAKKLLVDRTAIDPRELDRRIQQLKAQYPGGDS